MSNSSSLTRKNRNIESSTRRKEDIPTNRPQCDYFVSVLNPEARGDLALSSNPYITLLNTLHADRRSWFCLPSNDIIDLLQKYMFFERVNMFICETQCVERGKYSEKMYSMSESIVSTTPNIINKYVNIVLPWRHYLIYIVIRKKAVKMQVKNILSTILSYPNISQAIYSTKIMFYDRLARDVSILADIDNEQIHIACVYNDILYAVMLNKRAIYKYNLLTGESVTLINLPINCSMTTIEYDYYKHFIIGDKLIFIVCISTIFSTNDSLYRYCFDLTKEQMISITDPTMCYEILQPKCDVLLVSDIERLYSTISYSRLESGMDIAVNNGRIYYYIAQTRILGLIDTKNSPSTASKIPDNTELRVYRGSEYFHSLSICYYPSIYGLSTTNEPIIVILYTGSKKKGKTKRILFSFYLYSLDMSYIKAYMSNIDEELLIKDRSDPHWKKMAYKQFLTREIKVITG